MAKVIVVGSGPAGISAAIYLKRGGVDVTVLTKGSGILQKAELIENYYGIEKPISGKELEEIGLRQAENLGIELVTEEVVSINFEDMLIVEGAKKKYKADAIILATGVTRNSANIKNLKALEGKGVSYCATCDAFFYRGKDVAVLGNGDFALHEANAISAVAKSVTILTNEKEPTVDFGDSLILKDKVVEILGEQKVTGAKLANGSTVEFDGIFIALGVAGSVDLARKIGISYENNKILVDENFMTNVNGIYAVGDATGGLLQIAKAVYEGAQAATNLIKTLKEEKKI